MIKIMFEVSEDFIRENAKPDTTISKMAASDGMNAVKSFFDMLGFSRLEAQIDEGKTEFVVTTDKLDDKSNEIYNQVIAHICLLAAFSETDRKSE